MPKNIKRKRGGQPGNRNARKHGFFSSAMTPEELYEFWQNLKSGSGDRELVALRTKLFSALRAAPGNPRIVKEASRLLTKWCCSKYGLSAEEKAYAKKVFRFVCSEIGTHFSKTNEA
jgi:hypothetical protein